MTTPHTARPAPRERLIAEGGVSTYNSIKQELKDSFKFEEYYYEYQKDGKIYTILSNKFDEEMIDIFINDIFDNIDWQTSQSYISETDWTESINQYYKEKLDRECGFGL